MPRALAALLLAACSFSSEPPAPPGPDPQATTLAAQKLCYVFEYVDEDCRASQDVVEAGDRTLRVEAVVENAMDLPGGAARNVAYRVSLKGEEPAYRVEVVAKGTDPRDALDRGAQEWAALAGTALVDAVRDTGRSAAVHAALVAGRRAPADSPVPSALTLGSFRAYPGISDFRGAVQGGPRLDHAGLLEALAGPLGGLDPDGLHSVVLAMKHDGSRVQCERGEIDGSGSTALCRAAASFAWPAPVSPYAVRQVYILVPAGTPPEARPATDTPPQGAEPISGDDAR
jgi:hypothetical protein